MRELAADRFALDRFGIRMSMPAADTAKRQPVTPRFGPDDRVLSILKRPSAQVAQRNFFGLGYFSAAGEEKNFAKHWDEELNGPASTYFSCSEETVAIRCPRSPKKHGLSIVTVRMYWQGLRCWQCLAQNLEKALTSGSTLVSSTAHAADWSSLNGVVRPDMVASRSTSFAALWRCPACGTEWFIEPFNRRPCAGCKARVSIPEAATFLALRQALADVPVDVELGRVIATSIGGATDIVISGQNLLVCIEVDGSYDHGRPGSAQREYAKDEQARLLGASTIRLRGGMADRNKGGPGTKRLGASLHPETIDVPMSNISKDVHRAWPGLAAQLRLLAVPCPDLDPLAWKQMHDHNAGTAAQLRAQSIAWRTSENPLRAATA